MDLDFATLPVLPVFQDNRGISPVIVWIVVILLIILIFWLLWRERGKRSDIAMREADMREADRKNALAREAAAKAAAAKEAAAKEAVAKEAAMREAVQPEVIQPEAVQPVVIPDPAMRTAEFEIPVAPQVDNLEIIEGIGPKIASVLKAAGVTSFAQLAAMDPASIREILLAVNLRLADPGSWPEQARLAAAGDMTALQALQDRLKGGR